MKCVAPLLLVALLSSAASCTSNDDPPVAPDAGVDAPPPPPPTPDAATAGTVREVSCSSVVTAFTVIVQEPPPYEYRFLVGDDDVQPTIEVNDIVKFSMLRNHSATSGSAGVADDRYKVQNREACIQFLDPGTYRFFCSHDEAGAITVTAN